jgi:hypothetical protein
MLNTLALTAAVRVRFTSETGMPAGSAHLTGLTPVAVPVGLYSVPAGGTISKDLQDPVVNAYDAEERRTLVLGLATSGRLGDSVQLTAPPTAVILKRDYFSLRVLDLRQVLLGAPNPAWGGAKIEPRPPIRIGESLTFLPDGNDVLGAAAAALSGAVTESIVVSPQIDGKFLVPPAPGELAHWPKFPLPTVLPPAGSAVPIALRAVLDPAAAVANAAAGASTRDVVLTLKGLPAGAAVRAYNRLFSSDAVETRGDGAGGVADAAGVVQLLLHDPLGLHLLKPSPPTSVPVDSILHVDVVVVRATGEARIFGNVSVPIKDTATFVPPAANSLGTAKRSAVCNAAILGLVGPPPPAGTTPWQVALASLSEPSGGPRDAPRLPGMARRDLLVAGLALPTGGAWKAVLGAGRLAPELHNASPRLGAPGGTGGRETQAVGVATAGGPLAYDIARAGLRRTTSIFTRIEPLVGGAWDEPAASTSGTFAGAVLQTIAAACETPEFMLLKAVINPNDTSPKLIDQITTWATSLLGNAGLSAASLDKLNQLIAKIQSLQTGPTDASTVTRIKNELLREVYASCWGRRDAQWALRQGLGQAQRFVYIETPGLTPTASVPETGSMPAFAVDIFKTLAARLDSTPSLHVVVCCPQQSDYPPGFDSFIDREAAARRATLLSLPTASNPDPVGSRVTVFHPIGFPGRPSRLESTVVIVNDVWAMVGSSTLRRRGLTFDGGADLVCTDLALTEGRSAAIAAFRRTLQANRLGIPIPKTPAPGTPLSLPSSAWVRLADGVEAFHEIREMLRAGGLGRIAPLAPAEPPAIPASLDVVDPESETVDIVGLLLAMAGAA